MTNPIQLREVGPREAATISTSYPRRSPLSRGRNFMTIPIRPEAACPWEQPLIQAPFRAIEGSILENILESGHPAGHAMQQSIKGKVDLHFLSKKVWPSSKYIRFTHNTSLSVSSTAFLMLVTYFTLSPGRTNTSVVL
jgi:hypothetical protein